MSVTATRQCTDLGLRQDRASSLLLTYNTVVLSTNERKWFFGDPKHPRVRWTGAMCKQERLDGDGKPAQVGTKPHMEVLPGGITSPAMRKLITNVRWTIGLLSTINFLVLLLASHPRTSEHVTPLCLQALLCICDCKVSFCWKQGSPGACCIACDAG